MKTIEDIIELSKGEHPLEEVLGMAGLEEEKPFAVDGRFCSRCETELEVEQDEDWDENGFVILPYLWCGHCQRKVSP